VPSARSLKPALQAEVRYTTAEVARATGIGRAVLKNAQERGALAYSMHGGRRMMTQRQVDAYLASVTVRGPQRRAS
jgi:hypothetical protein